MTDRNSKVRRRIAAGKLRLRVRDLRNLGPRAEVLLAEIGIHSVEALREAASKARTALSGGSGLTMAQHNMPA